MQNGEPTLAPTSANRFRITHVCSALIRCSLQPQVCDTACFLLSFGQYKLAARQHRQACRCGWHPSRSHSKNWMCHRQRVISGWLHAKKIRKTFHAPSGPRPPLNSQPTPHHVTFIPLQPLSVSDVGCLFRLTLSSLKTLQRAAVVRTQCGACVLVEIGMRPKLPKNQLKRASLYAGNLIHTTGKNDSAGFTKPSGISNIVPFVFGSLSLSAGTMVSGILTASRA